jgi:uracil DNA glycosylase superfamily protein
MSPASATVEPCPDGWRTRGSVPRRTARHCAHRPSYRPINQFVDSIRDRDGRGWAPYIAPMHGGADAEVLSILRDPGPAAQDGSGSGFLAVENDDPTAERHVRLFLAAGISPRRVLPWNAYPWYFNRQPTAAELDAGAAVIVELLGLLPNLKVVLLQGRDAEAGWKKVTRSLSAPIEERGVTVLATIHPGRQVLFTPDRQERDRRVAHQEATLAHVAEIVAG